MEHSITWLNDLLASAKDDPSPDVVKLVESCGAKCAARQNVSAYFEQLRSEASGCKTRADYVAFLKEHMPIDISEAEDGIVMRLGKSKCTCPMAEQIAKDAGARCNCTRGHEKATWSIFFGKPVDVQIVESFLRGGNDCVIKIIV